MTQASTSRYALTGEVGAATSLTRDAFEGEVEQAWFQCQVDRKALKQLMRRTDTPALRHFGLWIALLVACGTGAAVAYGSWASLPLFALYGVFYSMSDHHAHELSHGTPFRTRWINEVLLHLNGFMTLHEVHYWRWSHTRHHTETLMVGRDPEIAIMTPPDLLRLALNFLFIPSGLDQIRNIFNHARGRIVPEGEHFIPAGERAKVIRLSRIYVGLFAATVVACFAFGSVLPVLLVVTPRFYGGFVAQFFNVTQHAGLRENVRDHRQDTRTFLAGPIGRFLYMNMNYHIEHHMFPMVPFDALPELHALIRAQCPPAYRSVWAAYAAFIPALLKQRQDPAYFMARPLPEAQPA